MSNWCFHRNESTKHNIQYVYTMNQITDCKFVYHGMHFACQNRSLSMLIIQVEAQPQGESWASWACTDNETGIISV